MTKLLEHSAVENATTVGMATVVILLARLNMVLASTDRFRAQNVVEIVTSRVFVCPLPNSVEHVPLDLDTFIPNSRVVESSKDVIDHLVDGNARVIPCIEDSARNLLVERPTSDRRGYHMTYGTTYWRTVAATRPAHGFKTLVK